MRIVFRVDSSGTMGTGHVMRCLTLAQWLKELNATILFICRELKGNIIDVIEKAGFPVVKLPESININSKTYPIATVHPVSGLFGDHSFDWETDADGTRLALFQWQKPVDWIVIDHYAIDYHWEQALQTQAKRIMVIDDLANRIHNCDVLLDQNFVEGYKLRYQELLPEHTVQLLGPKYALLRDEFYSARQTLRLRDGSLKRILVSFGGTDPTNETENAIEGLRSILHLLDTVDIIIGNNHQRKDSVRNLCESLSNVTLHQQVSNIARFMQGADLALGAGGTSTWERCYLGLPALTVIVAENQKPATEYLDAIGAAICLGESPQVTSYDYENILERLQAYPDKLLNMQNVALCLMEESRQARNLIQKTFLQLLD